MSVGTDYRNRVTSEAALEHIKLHDSTSCILADIGVDRSEEKDDLTRLCTCKVKLLRRCVREAFEFEAKANANLTDL